MRRLGSRRSHAVVAGGTLLLATLQPLARAESCRPVACDACFAASASPQGGGPAVATQNLQFAKVGPFYGTAGHYSTAYVVALGAGFTPAEAEELTYWTEYPDRDGRYDAIRGMLYWDAGYHNQVYIHSLRGGDPAPVRASLERLLHERRGKPWSWGLLVHALGDSYAHAYPVEAMDGTTLFRWPFGHAFAGHGPDIIANNKPKYAAYVEALFRALSRPDRPPDRCLVDGLVAFVQCPQWTVDTDEIAALNCFSARAGVPQRSMPFLDLTLSREAVDEWIEMVSDDVAEQVVAAAATAGGER